MLRCRERGIATGEEPPVLEENVDQLPEHVVEGLRELLADELIVAGRRE